MRIFYIGQESRLVPVRTKRMPRKMRNRLRLSMTVVPPFGWMFQGWCVMHHWLMWKTFRGNPTAGPTWRTTLCSKLMIPCACFRWLCRAPIKFHEPSIEDLLAQLGMDAKKCVFIFVLPKKAFSIKNLAGNRETFRWSFHSMRLRWISMKMHSRTWLANKAKS